MRQSDSGGGYLVAQTDDIVRVDLPGPLFGTFGKVIEQHTDPERGSVTARVCTVRSDGGATVEVHADYLKVIQ